MLAPAHRDAIRLWLGPSEIDPSARHAQRAVLDGIRRQFMERQHRRNTCPAIDGAYRTVQPDIVIAQEWFERLFGKVGESARPGTVGSEQVDRSAERDDPLVERVVRAFGIGVAPAERDERADHGEQVLQAMAKLGIEELL